MPWTESKIMDQRIEFAIKAMNCSNFQALCQEYGISRKTGYKWRSRFVSEGLSGLEDQSRRPDNTTDLPEEVVCRIVCLKQAHPHWGPRKIRDLYGRKHPSNLPSESSFKRVLSRAGLTVPRKRKRSTESGRLATGRKAEAPNEVWTVDFKGWWLSKDGKKVEPLTVRDEFSRMLLELRAVEDAKTITIREHFERLFEKNGIPDAIRSDNGSPFGCGHALLGLTRLSAWWLALGINLERGRPGCPQDNGAHERMHLDVMRELEAGRIGRDQDAFDLWRHEFNYERPHESLGMKRPAEVWTPSKRRFQGTPEELDYNGMATRKVNKVGVIQHEGEGVFVSTALAGWDVGICPCQDKSESEVWFARVLVGYLDPATASFRPASAGRKLAESSKSV
jgi:transposase InsO family protein